MCSASLALLMLAATADALDVGFIGLGIMGKGMAHNLAHKGRTLAVWNRSPQKAAELQAEHGADKIAVCATPAEVLQKCDLVYAMLSTPDVCKEVYEMPDGILDGVRKATKLVDCATLADEDMERLAEQVDQRGGRFLAAPVSGSKVPAETGQLIFLAGGDEALFAEATEDFDRMGKASFYLGSPGDAAKFKLVVNMIMGTMMSALGEGISLCKAEELDPMALIEVLDLGAMANPMFKLKGPKILQNDHAPNFPLRHAHKDMKLAIEEAERIACALPVTAAATAQYDLAMEAGFADDDFSAVTKV